MSRNLKTAQKEQTEIAEIVFHGEKLLIPTGMTVNAAIKLLNEHQAYLEESVELTFDYDCFPWDGANAMRNVMEAKYGWVSGKIIQTFFGKILPKDKSIPVGPNGMTITVPWGRIAVPNIDGYFSTGVCRKNGRLSFELTATVLRKDAPQIEQLAKEIGEYLNQGGSIYQGKAIKVRFRDKDGDPIDMPTPEFIDTSGYSREKLIYSKHIEAQVETNLFVPIERIQDCIENGISVKRGVLLGGPYGTGKTLAASVAARIATDNNVTFVYVDHADELHEAIQFAKMYERSGCVVFAEDIDREVKGNRTVEMDEILNIIDGIDTKHSRIMTILTTNHLENINPAMLRPGRLDTILDIQPPDAEAVERLIRAYANGALEDNIDLTVPAAALAHQIPAIIEECIKRSKLAQLALQKPGTKLDKISAEAITSSAKSMEYQIKVLADQSRKEIPADPTFNELLQNAASAALAKDSRIKEIHCQVT